MTRHVPLLAYVLAVVLAGCSTCAPPARTDIPTLRAARRTTPITLDGVLDEGAWRGASETERFVDTMDGTESGPESTARVLWDDTHLYVAFEVADDFLASRFEGHDAHLWEQDAVELMVDPDGDGLGYFELQVSPTELSFDTRFDTVRRPAPFGYPAYESGIEAGVHTDGTPNDGEDDEGYTVELRIPFVAFAVGSDPVAAPRAGDTWRVALYVLDARRDGQRGVGWSAPMVGDFHVPERFGRITFVDGS